MTDQDVGTITFRVLGDAQPAGSKRAFANKATGKVIVTDDNAKGKPWRQEVRAMALEARHATGVAEPLYGPVALDVTFVRCRPPGHFGTGRNATRVRPSAPAFPVTRPDTTKLLRCLEDALTGVLWRDDAQVVDQRAKKVFGVTAMTVVTVTCITPGAGAP
jgi:Holliday junction resolvase RusA-like endonuclease